MTIPATMGAFDSTAQEAEARAEAALAATGGTSQQQSDVDPFKGLLPDNVDPNAQIVRPNYQSDYVPGVGRVQSDAPVNIARVTNGDIEAIVNGNPAQRALWISRFVHAGLVDDGAVDPTLWNDDYTSILQDLARLGNANGLNLVEAMGTVTRISERQRQMRGGGGGGRQIPAYRAPDPATLRRVVKSALRSELRRDPTEQELAELGAEWASFDRQAYNAQVSQGQQVDPSARFSELIESKYADELGFIEDRDEVAVATQQFGQQMSFVDRILGAG